MGCLFRGRVYCRGKRGEHVILSPMPSTRLARSSRSQHSASPQRHGLTVKA